MACFTKILRSLTIFIMIVIMASCVVLPRKRFSFGKTKNRYLVNLKYADVNVLVRQNVEKAGIPGKWIEYDTYLESSAYRLPWYKRGMLAHEIMIDIYPAEDENKTIIDYSHKYREPNKYQLDIFENQSNTETMVANSWQYSRNNTAIPTNLEDIILDGFNEFSEKLHDLKTETDTCRKKYIDDYFKIGDFVFGEPASCRKAKDICNKAKRLNKTVDLESNDNDIEPVKLLEIELEYEGLNIRCQKLKKKCQEDKEGPKTGKERLEEIRKQEKDNWTDSPGFPQ